MNYSRYCKKFHIILSYVFAPFVVNLKSIMKRFLKFLSIFVSSTLNLLSCLWICSCSYGSHGSYKPCCSLKLDMFVIVFSTSSSSLRVISNMKLTYVKLWRHGEKRSLMLNSLKISVAKRDVICFSCC